MSVDGKPPGKSRRGPVVSCKVKGGGLHPYPGKYQNWKGPGWGVTDLTTIMSAEVIVESYEVLSNEVPSLPVRFFFTNKFTNNSDCVVYSNLHWIQLFLLVCSSVCSSAVLAAWI